MNIVRWRKLAKLAINSEIIIERREHVPKLDFRPLHAEVKYGAPFVVRVWCSI